MEIKDLIGKKVISQKYGKGVVKEISTKENLLIQYNDALTNQGFPKLYPSIFSFTDTDVNRYATRLSRMNEEKVASMMGKEALKFRHSHMLERCDGYNEKGTQLSMPKTSDRAFIKLEGTTNDMNDILTVNSVIDDDGETKYLLNFSKVSERIEDNNEFFITKGIGSDTVHIYGRGIVAAYKSDNLVKDSWVEQHPWMRDEESIKKNKLTREKYVFVKEFEVLATELNNCPKLEDVFEEYGGDILASKVGKNPTKKELAEVHYQKSHLFLSEAGYVDLNKEFEEAAKKYGTYKFSTPHI